ncbi:TetR/AcrR family transcriptional regulator [Aeromicrobium camelliae]|uniref:TetR/AcrR family transcriptional regulator n=1 Tax=Aeromicrobium camelliae TaxID=1538144 RepID=UPI00140820CF|nr:TetR family transcriptional regulator [Aeromicrobium camelliae]
MDYRYGGSRRGVTAVTAEDVPASERILHAAIGLYGEHGFDGVTLKQIAEQAGVSTPLILHHFGSKAGLRVACDRHVAEEFQRTKTESVRQATPIPRNRFVELMQQNRHLVKYLLRAFLAGGPEMDELFDRLVEDSLRYMAEAEAIGLMYPSRNRRDRAVILLLSSFGMLLLHEQVRRQFGASIIDDPPENLLPYVAALIELYTQPVFNAELYEQLMNQATPPSTSAEERGTHD